MGIEDRLRRRTEEESRIGREGGTEEDCMGREEIRREREGEEYSIRYNSIIVYNNIIYNNSICILYNI